MQHDAVDDQITKDEMGDAPMGDTTLEGLKKQRPHLKDWLYHMASGPQNPLESKTEN